MRRVWPGDRDEERHQVPIVVAVAEQRVVVRLLRADGVGPDLVARDVELTRGKADFVEVAPDGPRASPKDVAQVGVTVYRLQLGVEPVDGDADGVQHLVEQLPLGRFQIQSRDQCAVLLDRGEVVQRSGVDVAEEVVDLSERTTTTYGVECSRRVVVDVLPQRHEHAVSLVGAGVDRPCRGNDLPAGPVEEGRDRELPLEGLSDGRAAIRYYACDERLRARCTTVVAAAHSTVGSRTWSPILRATAAAAEMAASTLEV